MRSNPNNHHATKTPLSKRRLKTKPVLTLVAILFVGNIFWFALWLWPNDSQFDGGDEKVATVDSEEITRQEWLVAMESRYGKETLQSLVNEAVMEKAANKYGLKISDEEIDLEIALMRSAQDSTDRTLQQLTEDQLRQKVRSQLILEKVLTKDVITEDEEIEKYFKENQSLYNIPTTYRTNIIVVETKDEAASVIKELKNGSEFSVLARERSLDTNSASLGGDIGYITTTQANIDKNIQATISKLKVNEISEPIVLNDGRFGIVVVKEVNESKVFTYEEVDQHIKRVLSMEQLPTSITPEAFWKEFDATWFYGETES